MLLVVLLFLLSPIFIHPCWWCSAGGLQSSASFFLPVPRSCCTPQPWLLCCVSKQKSKSKLLIPPSRCSVSARNQERVVEEEVSIYHAGHFFGYGFAHIYYLLGVDICKRISLTVLYTWVCQENKRETKKKSTSLQYIHIFPFEDPVSTEKYQFVCKNALISYFIVDLNFMKRW